jgi:hypothetical protein
MKGQGLRPFTHPAAASDAATERGADPGTIAVH